MVWTFGIILLTSITIFAGLDTIVMVMVAIEPSHLIVFLLAMCALQFYTVSLTARQWHILLRRDVPSIRFRDVLRIHLAGSFVEGVTPSSKFGGEAVKVYLFRQHTGLEYGRLASFMIAHKYLSLLPFMALCLLFLIAALGTYEVPTVVHISFLGLALLMSALILIIHRSGGDGPESDSFPRLHSGLAFLRRAGEDVKDLIDSRDRNVILSYSIIIWALYPVKIWATAAVLGLDVSFGLAVLAVFAAYLVSMLPLTPGGLGTFEGTMALVLTANGLLLPEAVAIALTARLITFWFPLIWSAVAALQLVRAGELSRDLAAVHSTE